MERLTTRDKNGVAVMRSDLPPGQGNNLVARLADYEDSGLTPEKAAVIGWIGKTAWMLCIDAADSKTKIFDGIVEGIFFDGRISLPAKVRVEVLLAHQKYYVTQSFPPENVFLTREDAEAALAQLMEREARG